MGRGKQRLDLGLQQPDDGDAFALRGGCEKRAASQLQGGPVLDVECGNEGGAGIDDRAFNLPIVNFKSPTLVAREFPMTSPFTRKGTSAGIDYAEYFDHSMLPDRRAEILRGNIWVRPLRGG